MRLLLSAVVIAQGLDAATWLVMPDLAEVNPLAQGIHSTQGLALKALLLVYLFAVEGLLHFALPSRVPFVNTINRNLAPLLAVVAISVGCVGAGSNLAVLSALGDATTMRLMHVL